MVAQNYLPALFVLGSDTITTGHSVNFNELFVSLTCNRKVTTSIITYMAPGESVIAERILHTRAPSRMPHYTFRSADRVTSVKVEFYSSFVSGKSSEIYEVRETPEDKMQRATSPIVTLAGDKFHAWNW